MPDWGRVLAAAGRADVPFVPDRASLWFGDLQVLHNGRPLPLDESRALEILTEENISMHLDLGGGSGEATIWTCDFSHDYVTINGAYRT
ncbi:MAG: bifunctional ornithine acetyltransferase/N-acetylglutamate synthase [Armatimonadetes bacterium]|nr:bifunctional ornithine acetyltransferase/N-acetylglutamate synthase [Armatimonadota bacterium]